MGEKAKIFLYTERKKKAQEERKAFYFCESSANFLLIVCIVWKSRKWKIFYG